MNGLKEHIHLLNTIEDFFRIAETTSIKGMNVLDISETRGKVFLKFDCPDRHFPEYSFAVEFQVTREFFESNLKKLLKVEV